MKGVEVKNYKLIPFTKPIVDECGLMLILGIGIKQPKDRGMEESKGFLSGLHFNPSHRMDNCLSDIIVDNATGIVTATVHHEGLTKKNNTFFPSSWAVEKLMEELQKAMLNPIKVLRSGNLVIFVGEASGGVRIKIMFEESGRMLTAYPVLEKN